MTVIYFVRHAHSDYTPDEYGRKLSDRGAEDAERVREQFKDVPVDLVFSSPYARAIETVKGVAEDRGLDVHIIEELKERRLAEEPVDDFPAAVDRLWSEPDYAFPGGESNETAQQRGGDILRVLLEEHKGKNIVIGSHGNMMVLTMKHFNASYDLDFWKQLTMPDVYKLTFEGADLVEVDRMWDPKTKIGGAH
ncbi:histidine phosphatase family protein [Pseudalkalibacillus sp. Hm43]|uniref:histidine phosphatase family protein n=1 Tax=Pseudalkalibacillus sp. Hm43 TaxID=3450742 RepID=UPI003F43B688